MLNQNRIAFNVNVLFSATSPGAYILSFTPLDTIVFYSASFSVIATTPAATGLLDLGRYCKLDYNLDLTPTLLSNSSRTAGADQETFTLTAGMTLSNANFELRNFISCFDSYHPNGIAGLLLAPLATYTAGSDQFSVIISVEAGSSLSLCSMIAIAINKDALLVGHSEFAMTGFQVSGNFLAVANSYLSAYSSANFSIPSFYGSEMSRNCSIGFNGMKAGTDSSTKTMMVAYNSNSGSMSSSEASGGGIWGEYQVLCVVDCNSDAFYYSPLSRCDYCSTYIPYCEACSSEILCTDCGVNSFYDSISKTCRCSFGNRVTGGCTTVMACSSVDDSGICQTCKPGFTLNSSHICACPAGYSVVTNVCIDVPGCITAELIHGVPRCFSCNFSQHFQTDGNGSCLCKSGYSLLNGICVTVCGNGELFGIEQCDDGNHVSGDGCSSLCQVEKSYECNTTLDLQSVCAYKAQFAEIRLVESYRDT
jgi:cysteine-rich repeat protein